MFLGNILTYANQLANLKSGATGTSVGVGDLFAGSLVPGLPLVLAYALYVVVLAWLCPAAAPAMVEDNDGPAMSGRERSAMFWSGLVAPGALVIAVPGFIPGGIATPTEAASVGAIGATLPGADPVWLGVMIAVNLQTSFLTPPFGFACSFCAGSRRQP